MSESVFDGPIAREIEKLRIEKLRAAARDELRAFPTFRRQTASEIVWNLWHAEVCVGCRDDHDPGDEDRRP